MVATIGSILDDLKRIKTIDKSDMCGIHVMMPESCEDALRRAEKVEIPKVLRITKEIVLRYKIPKKIAIVGMGGSAIGGNILRDWLKDEVSIPIEVLRDYHLPAYADEDTLIFAVSYSGNTEETLSGFLEALQKRCMVFAMSSNGLLEVFSRGLNIPFVKLPKALPPRCALPYLFFPLVVTLEKLGVIGDRRREIEEAIFVLKQLREEIKPESPTSKNLAKMLASAIEGTIPVVYGFRFYEGTALRIKTQFNENSKVPSKSENFPELNHNETVGWEGPKKITEKFSVILIRDVKEPPEIKSRIELTKELILVKKTRKTLELYGRGESKLAKILSTIYIGDFASIYLAILNQIDPTSVNIITKMKDELEKRTGIIEGLKEKFREIATKSKLCSQLS